MDPGTVRNAIHYYQAGKEDQTKEHVLDSNYVSTASLIEYASEASFSFPSFSRTNRATQSVNN
jgi:hypothetical protein